MCLFVELLNEFLFFILGQEFHVWYHINEIHSLEIAKYYTKVSFSELKGTFPVFKEGANYDVQEKYFRTNDWELRPELKLSLQLVITGYRREIRLTRRSA